MKPWVKLWVKRGGEAREGGEAPVRWAAAVRRGRGGVRGVRRGPEGIPAQLPAWSVRPAWLPGPPGPPGCLASREPAVLTAEYLPTYLLTSLTHLAERLAGKGDTRVPAAAEVACVAAASVTAAAAAG